MTHILKTQMDGKDYKVPLFYLRQGKQHSISSLWVANVLNNNNLCS